MSKKSSDSSVDKVKKQESKYDANVLRDLIRNGKTASEIMLAMDIGHKQILKHRSGFTSLDQSTAKLRWTVLLVMPPI